MGLAASQARLLTITARKSDCEYESMRLSHQKIALSRELNAISNEYQNSLNQTSLYFDFYGNGDLSNPLTYPLLMTPSALNDYLPMFITNSQKRIVLISKYAAAARAAGIPQEGLGGLPSDDLRNAFVNALFQNGLITSATRDSIQSIPYNQEAGLGNTDLASVITEDWSLSTLIENLRFVDANPTDSNYNNTLVREFHLFQAPSNGGNSDSGIYLNVARRYMSNHSMRTEGDKVTFAELLGGNQDYILKAFGADNRNNLTVQGGMTDAISNSSFWETMFDLFEGLLDTGDTYTQNALSYARSNIEPLIENLGRDCTDYSVSADGDGQDGITKNVHSNFGYWYDKSGDDLSESMVWAYSDTYKALNAVGLVGVYNSDNYGSSDNDSCNSLVEINLSTMLKAYLTYFAQYMEGLTTSEYCVEKTKSGSNFVDENFTFKVVTGESIPTGEAKTALFYDTLFNQLCVSGWTENDEVNDREYLQEMLKNGMLYISTIGDDNYYTQGNYSTNKLIKEFSDDSEIAAAEAKYQTQKAHLSSKEDEIDLKMKNLDTEISALTTEYDSVKSVITKNIEKSFKRYNA